MVIVTVDWSEHPDLLDVDDWVRNTFPKYVRDHYFSRAYDRCECLDDYKFTARQWADEYIDLFEELKNRVDKLPSGRGDTVEIEEVEE